MINYLYFSSSITIILVSKASELSLLCVFGPSTFLVKLKKFRPCKKLIENPCFHDGEQL